MKEAITKGKIHGLIINERIKASIIEKILILLNMYILFDKLIK